MNRRILVVENDARRGATLERVLAAEGHHLELVGDRPTAQAGDAF
jgi:DNA-binding response OmpR family regulator